MIPNWTVRKGGKGTKYSWETVWWKEKTGPRDSCSEWAAPSACGVLSFLLPCFGQDYSHWGESFKLNIYYFCADNMVTQAKLNRIWSTSWNSGLRYIILPPPVAWFQQKTSQSKNGMPAVCQHLFSNKSVTLFPLPPNLISHKCLITNNKQ